MTTRHLLYAQTFQPLFLRHGLVRICTQTFQLCILGDSRRGLYAAFQLCILGNCTPYSINFKNSKNSNSHAGRETFISEEL